MGSSKRKSTKSTTETTRVLRSAVAKPLPRPVPIFDDPEIRSYSMGHDKDSRIKSLRVVLQNCVRHYLFKGYTCSIDVICYIHNLILGVEIVDCNYKHSSVIVLVVPDSVTLTVVRHEIERLLECCLKRAETFFFSVRNMYKFAQEACSGVSYFCHWSQVMRTADDHEKQSPYSAQPRTYQTMGLPSDVNLSAPYATTVASTIPAPPPPILFPAVSTAAMPPPQPYFPGVYGQYPSATNFQTTPTTTLPTTTTSSLQGPYMTERPTTYASVHPTFPSCQYSSTTSTTSTTPYDLQSVHSAPDDSGYSSSAGNLRI